MAELTRSEFDRHRGNVGKLINGGASDADLNFYLRDNDLTRQQLLPQAAPDFVPIPEPIQPGPTDTDVVSPTGARITGGAIGATLGVPLGPPGMLAGGALLGEGFGQAAEIINRFRSGDEPPPLLQQSLEAGSNILTDAALTGAGAQVGRLTRQAFRGLPGRTINPATGTRGADIRRAAESLDIPTTGLGQGLQPTRGFQRTFEAASGLPGGAGTIQRSIQSTQRGIDRALDTTIESFGVPRSKAIIGRRLKQGAKGFTDNFRAQMAVKYSDMGKLFDKNAQVTMAHTLETLAENVDDFATTPNIGSSVNPQKLLGWLRDIEGVNGKLTWRQAASFRTAVGDMLGDPKLSTDVSRGTLKRVYGSLTADMEGFVATKGDRALQQWRRLGAQYKAGSARIDMLESISKSDIVSDTFNAAFRGAEDSAQRLTAVKRSMDGDTWNDLVATKLHEMGKATPGTAGTAGGYSPATFLTNWNKLSADAKAVMFGAKNGLRQKLDRLTDVIAAFGEGGAVANRSQTAHTSAFQDFIQGRWIQLGERGAAKTVRGLAGATMSPLAISRLMTNEVFLTWLTKGADVVRANPRGFGAHIGRLIAVAKVQPELREDIQIFLAQLDGEAEIRR